MQQFIALARARAWQSSIIGGGTQALKSSPSSFERVLVLCAGSLADARCLAPSDIAYAPRVGSVARNGGPHLLEGEVFEEQEVRNASEACAEVLIALSLLVNCDRLAAEVYHTHFLGNKRMNR